MNVGFAALLVGLAGLIAALGCLWILTPPTRKWIVIAGSCAIPATLAIIVGVISFTQRPPPAGAPDDHSVSTVPTVSPHPGPDSPSATSTAEKPWLDPPTATVPDQSPSRLNPDTPPETRPLTAQAGPEPCPTGDEVQLDFDRYSSGLAVPFTGTVDCPAQDGRAYVLIVELNFENRPHYYPKQEITSRPGEFHDSVSMVDFKPNSTRKIFVISIDRTQLPQLRNTGSGGELVNRLPGSHKPASMKYPHTRTR